MHPNQELVSYPTDTVVRSACITQEINMIGLTKSGFIMVINAIFPVGINEAILNTKSMHRIQLLFGYFSLLTTFLSLIFGTI